MFGEHHEESSSNWLVNHYHAVNWEAGHQRSCGYGAGADCSCVKGEFLGFVIRVKFGGEFVVVECEDDHKLANKLARRYQRGGWKVQYTCEKFHTSDESFDDLRASAGMWRDKIEDLRTD